MTSVLIMMVTSLRMTVMQILLLVRSAWSTQKNKKSVAISGNITHLRDDELSRPIPGPSTKPDCCPRTSSALYKHSNKVHVDQSTTESPYTTENSVIPISQDKRHEGVRSHCNFIGSAAEINTKGPEFKNISWRKTHMRLD